MSELLKINVNEHAEKKNGLTYLSWAWAWAEVLKIDPQATWEVIEFDGLPCRVMPDKTAMVKTSVTIKGHAKTCWLPVMNHRNQAIVEPDAFQINTAIMRCMTKAISMHGLGLYIYAGEDLPEDEKVKPSKILPTDGAGDGLEPERKAYLEELALDMIEAHKAGNDLQAITAYYFLDDNDEKVYIWKLLATESKLRAILKANNPAKAKAEA